MNTLEVEIFMSTNFANFPKINARAKFINLQFAKIQRKIA